MDPVQGSRLVSATAAFVTVATLAFLVGEATAPLAGILLATALFGMSATYVVHVSVLSEPLFLAFLALTLAAMVRRDEKPWLAGLWAALAALTRYAGISAVGAAALWSVARRGTIGERARRGMWALLPAAVLQGLWFVRTKLVASASSIRELALYGNLGKSIHEGATTLTSWLVPDADGALDPADAMPHRRAIAAVAGALLVVVVLTGTVRALRRHRTGRTGAGDDASDPTAALRLLAASTLLVACYLALLIVSRLIADPGIPFDERILSPVIVLGTTIAATGIALWWRSTRAELPKIALCGALLGWWFGAASTTWVDASYVMAWGSDFGGDQWHRSELLAWAVQQLADRALFLSREAGARRAPPERDCAARPVRRFASRARRARARVRRAGHRVRARGYVGEGAGASTDHATARWRRVRPGARGHYTSTPADSRSSISSAVSAPPNR
jgi:hypothetical protein